MRYLKLIFFLLLFSLINESCKTTYSNFGGGFNSISSNISKLQYKFDSTSSLQLIQNQNVNSTKDIFENSPKLDGSKTTKILKIKKKFQKGRIHFLKIKEELNHNKTNIKLNKESAKSENTASNVFSIIAFVLAIVSFVFGVIGFNTNGLGNAYSMISLLFALLGELFSFIVLNKKKGSIINPYVSLGIILISCILWFVGCKNALSCGGW